MRKHGPRASGYPPDSVSFSGCAWARARLRLWAKSVGAFRAAFALVSIGKEPREKPRSRAGSPQRIDREHGVLTESDGKQRRRARPCIEIDSRRGGQGEHRPLTPPPAHPDRPADHGAWRRFPHGDPLRERPPAGLDRTAAKRPRISVSAPGGMSLMSHQGEGMTRINSWAISETARMPEAFPTIENPRDANRIHIEVEEQLANGTSSLAHSFY